MFKLLLVAMLSLYGSHTNAAIYKMPVEQSTFFKVEPIENGPVCGLGEGPYWDPTMKELLYVDAFVGDIHRFNTETISNTKHSTGVLASIIIPILDSDNEFITTQRNKLVKFNWQTKTIKIIAQVPADERFNDAKVDSEGRLWIGTILEKDKKIVPHGGALYKLVGKELIKMSQDYTISNGMAWNKNNSLMFFNDSEDQKTYVFDFNSTNGTIDNKRIIIDYKNNKHYSDEYPDGMAIDKNDEIWIALYNGARIIRISSEGELLASVNIPAKQITSLTFGGNNYDTLYVTSGSETIEKDKQPNAGKVFRVTQNIELPNALLQGVPSNRVKI